MRDKSEKAGRGQLRHWTLTGWELPPGRAGTAHGLPVFLQSPCSPPRDHPWASEDLASTLCPKFEDS